MIKETIGDIAFEIIENTESKLIATAEKEETTVRAEYEKTKCKKNKIEPSNIQLLNYRDKHIKFGSNLKYSLNKWLREKHMDKFD